MDKSLSGIKNIYLIGIGGIGMSGLAFLLKDKGFCIKGSDIQQNSIVSLLKEQEIEVFIGHNAANMPQETQLICYSSAIKEDNPEIIEAKKRGITVLPRGKLLGLICWDKKTIAVSGSHGKTTTTSLIGYLLTALGHKPTVYAGGLSLNYNRNAWWGDEYFVIETDESDGSFLYYNPWVSIITNIDYEHLDYYKTIANLKDSFLQFAYQTKGVVIGCGDDNGVYEIISKAGGITYGFEPRNRIVAKDFYYDGKLSCFDCYVDSKFIGHIRIPLLGRHNALNTLAVIAFFKYLSEDLNKVIGLLQGFKGTKRRFQIKKTLEGVTFIDDYAHHPTEIDAVLKAARFLNPKRVFVIFQPHRFSRVESLYKQFSQCFSSADELIVTDIYSACEKNRSGIDAHFLSQEIKKNFSGSVRHIPKEKLPKEVPPVLRDGDIVLGLGAGDINNIMDGIINEFQRHCLKTQPQP